MMNARQTIPARPKSPQPAMVFSSTGSRLLQRKCACGGTPGPTGECEACRKKRLSLQRKSRNSELGSRNDSSVPPIVHEVLRSPGQPLDSATRAFMERRFGHDFSHVRVHTNARASASARAVCARAYTVGQDVVFGIGEYAPNTSAGRRLIAHELSHTLQQRPSIGSIRPLLEISSPVGAAEQEADNTANAVSQLGTSANVNAFPQHVARQEDTDQNAVTEENASQDTANQEASPVSPGCVPATGVPNTDCSAYLSNQWWLPLAYVNNATCACNSTPNVPTAKCVRKFLQDRLAATPGWLKALAAAQKFLEISPVPGSYAAYQIFVQTVLTPRIYQDHVDAYRSCCCPSGPAPYYDWIGVTSAPIQPCSLVGLVIRYFGSCSGTPGAW